jgi:ABC-type proline/glycine betaine transport system ATPase subunit
MGQIKEILKGRGKTAVFVTHSPKEALMLSDRIALIEAGKLVQFDCYENLRDQPANETIKELFGKGSLYL